MTPSKTPKPTQMMPMLMLTMTQSKKKPRSLKSMFLLHPQLHRYLNQYWVFVARAVKAVKIAPLVWPVLRVFVGTHRHVGLAMIIPTMTMMTTMTTMTVAAVMVAAATVATVAMAAMMTINAYSPVVLKVSSR